MIAFMAFELKGLIKKIRTNNSLVKTKLNGDE
jgi:hypothetical protein